MAVNKSQNKVQVIKAYGESGAIGYCDPQVGMLTQYGKILSLDSGNFTVVVGVGSGAIAGNGRVPWRYYPIYLEVASGEAGRSVAWPTGVGCVQIGHNRGFLAGGSPKGVASGVSYLGGDGSIYTYGRVGSPTD